MTEVSIEWARDGRGVWRWAGEFRGVDQRDYRGITCRQGHQLIPVAGESGKVAPHFRHETTGTGCTAEETTEHYRAKERVAAWLNESPGRVVWIAGPCSVPGCRRRCAAAWEIPAWSSVAVEARVGTRRPDIVLFDDHAAVAAIEIMHTHRVDARKRADMGIPWFEVSTLEIAAWSGGAFVAEQRSAESPAPCDRCRRVVEDRAALDARQDVEDREKAEQWRSFCLATKRHWDKVFAEQWARDYIARTRQ